MLKKNFITALLVVSVISVFAQEATMPLAPKVDRTGMDIGVQIGPGLSILYNQDPIHNPRNPYKSTLSSSSFGLTWQYNFPKIISIHAEANFERKGDFLYLTDSRNTMGDGQQLINKSYAYDRIDYMTIPVTARLSFGNTVQFFTDLGMYTGFRTNASRAESSINYGVGESASTTSQVSTNTDLTNDIRKIDAGLVTGLGVSVPLWKTINFTFEARNNLGLVNMNNNSSLYQNKFYNNSTVFLIGLNAHIGRPMKASTKLKYEQPMN